MKLHVVVFIESNFFSQFQHFARQFSQFYGPWTQFKNRRKTPVSLVLFLLFNLSISLVTSGLQSTQISNNSFCSTVCLFISSRQSVYP